MKIDEDITVGDLVALLLKFPQDAKAGVRGGLGGSFRPISEIGKVELVTLIGETEADRLSLPTSDDMAKKWQGKKNEPFITVIID